VKSVKFGLSPALKGLGCVLLAVQVAAALPASAEDRTLSMYNIHTKETISVTFKKDGKYIPEGLQQLNQFMRDWRRNLVIKMDPALIDLIWELHEELGSKEPVHLICGYRSSATNETLRRTVGGQARNSRHITGQAADLMFPDVPLKQLRYSALIRERGGVGYYPASGLPFVHVDTGNVRHWPRVSRMELAILFPKGHSRHVPADGRPITPADARMALAKYQASGAEMPWALTHKTAGPMLASLNPAGAQPVLQQASLSSTESSSSAKPDNLAKGPGETPELQLSEEGEEQEDVIAFEPLPANLLLSEKPLSYIEVPDDQPRGAVSQKWHVLMSPPSELASEEFERGLQMEELYGASRFKGSALALIKLRKRRMIAASAVADGKQMTR
jgi:uncharacterized protein YcbK (DUF882 family)